MTESHRTKLLTACAFAKVFLEAADAELRGAGSKMREESSEHLRAALYSLDLGFPPVDLEAFGFDIPSGATITGFRAVLDVQGNQLQLVPIFS